LVKYDQFCDGNLGNNNYEYEQCGDHICPGYIISRVKENSSGNFINAYAYFDGLGRKIQTIAFGEGNKSIVSKLFYDEMGRNYLAEGPFFSAGVGYPKTPPSEYPWVETIFDYRGRPVEISSPNDEYGIVSITCDYNGFSAVTTDPDGSQSTEKKDYLGRIIQIIEHADAGLQYTNYTYNAAGDMLNVTDHHGNLTTINYDTLGRKINMTDPDMGFWQYTYDANGNLKTQTDAKNQVITFTYDNLNRVTKKEYSTSDPTVTYTYDFGIQNGIGRVFSVTNLNVTTTYNAYDTVGRAVSVSKQISGDPNTYTTLYGYDLSGKLISTTYPDNYQVNNYFHTGTGFLHMVLGITDSTEYATFTDYEPTGKIGKIEHGNGTATRYTYDSKSTRLFDILTQDPSKIPENDLQRRQYSYSRAGDIEQITDDLREIRYNYTYDKLHRLLTESNTGSYDPLTYTYNAIGNITTQSVGSTTANYIYNTVHKHAVNQISLYGTDYYYTYDANGNMTSGPDFTDPMQIASKTITYNADNMPVQIEHAGTVVTNFIYNGNGVRAAKSVQGGSTTFYISANFEVVDGEPVKYIFAGNLRIARVTASEKDYFHKDHLGSSTVMTDDTGTPFEASEFMPFGKLRDHIGTEVTDYKFTDQELDNSTNLYNYNARMYDPVIGRFISPDSIVPNPFDPQSLNRYSYCLNNPLIYVDPSGHYYIPWEGIIGGIIGGISAGIQTDWDSEAVWIGQNIGFIAGELGSYVGSWYGGVFGGEIAASIVGGAVSGATSGGLNAAYYGGDIGNSMLSGAGYGAVGGAVFGAINYGYDGGWGDPSRIAVQGLAGGGLAELQGGEFKDGFTFAFSTAMAAWSYNKITSSVPRTKGPTKPAEYKLGKHGTIKIDPDRVQFGNGNNDPTKPIGGGWLDFNEGSKLSNFMAKKVFSMHPISIHHDTIGQQWFSKAVWTYAKWPTMIYSAVETWGALAATNNFQNNFAIYFSGNR